MNAGFQVHAISERHSLGSRHVNALSQREPTLGKEDGHVGAHLFAIAGREIPDVR
jgi:hypothetical protein